MTKNVNASYHHGDLRQALIEAACVHLKDNGADSLSLRALAREVGVSQTAPYRHFKTKNAVFAAIAVYGFTLLTEELTAARDRHVDNVEEALVGIGLAYIAWARVNPEKYQLFFDSSLVDFDEHLELQICGSGCFNVLMSVIRKGLDSGAFVSLPAEQLAASMWSGIHGICGLLNSKQDKVKDPAREVMGALGYLAEAPETTVRLMVKGILKH